MEILRNQVDDFMAIIMNVFSSYKDRKYEKDLPTNDDFKKRSFAFSGWLVHNASTAVI